jgi:F0F1-type ATP synthase alpha subunit
MKKVAGKLKLELAQFAELEAFLNLFHLDEVTKTISTWNTIT